MAETPSHPELLAHIRLQCCQGCLALQSQWQQATRNAQRGLQQGQQALQSFMQHSAQQLQALSVATQRRGEGLAFASLSMGASRPSLKRNPLFQLASTVAGIRERVAGIPVYTVANKKNELVLVAGEHEGEKKQLGLFFFTEKDAQALIEQIREQNPSLAKDSQVMTIGMSDVYDIADKGNQDLAFRFMPDAEQVKQALQIIEEAGVEVNGFTGVPVFQATGLSVKTTQSRRTPLFFNKSDLDAAVGNAYSQKMTQREQVTQAKVDRAQQDMADARKQVSEAKDEAARSRAQAEVDKAEERISKYSERLADVQHSTLPGIEVGSLEEVLSKMEKDKDGSWSDVMFVPPGAASLIQEPSTGKE